MHLGNNDCKRRIYALETVVALNAMYVGHG